MSAFDIDTVCMVNINLGFRHKMTVLNMQLAKVSCKFTPNIAIEIISKIK